MKPETEDKWLVCRVCLQEARDLHDIFSSENEEDISEMLHQCGGIPVNPDDNYPDKICTKCVRCLRVAHKFRRTCQQSHEHITIMLNAGPVIMDPQHIDDDSIGQGMDSNDLDDCIKVESIEISDEGQVFDDTQYEYYGQGTEVDIDESQNLTEADDDVLELGEYAEYEIVEESIDGDDRDNVVIDDDEEATAPDVLTSDEEYLPQSEVKLKTQYINKNRAKLLTENDRTDEDSSKRRGRRTKNKQQQFICDVCGNIYRMQARLTEHMKFHSGIKPHECEICGRGFVQHQQLVRHMNTHTGNRPYKCNYCPAAFADRSTKTKHHRIHTKQRPYQCDVCSKTFTYSDNLKFHKMIHTGEKPHVCDICGKGFTKAYKMRLHRSTHEKRGITSKLEMKFEENLKDC